MILVGVREAKDGMAHLIDRALAGEEVIITRRGERVARIEALPEEEERRRLREEPTRGGGCSWNR
jgi:antitoxin (DNA-binding transcriptional repressor) of toxin-antitoxin stability system